MIRAGWLVLAAATLIIVILIGRRQMIPEPWGYVVYDRISGSYQACEVTEPDEYLTDFDHNGQTAVPNPAYDPKATAADAWAAALAAGKPDPTVRTIPGPFDRAKAIRETKPMARCVNLPSH